MNHLTIGYTLGNGKGIFIAVLSISLDRIWWNVVQRVSKKYCWALEWAVANGAGKAVLSARMFLEKLQNFDTKDVLIF